jgi:signal transduction histidine kinase
MGPAALAGGGQASNIGAVTAIGEQVDYAQIAIELLVEVLSSADADLDTEGFYSRLAEVVCRIGDMSRAVIFRFDDVTRRVRAAGAHGIELELFAGTHMIERAPDAARALAEDRVIEVDPSAHSIPAEFAEMVRDRTLVYVPIAAAGRWPGVIIAEPHAGAPPLDRDRKELLWTLGKTLALASMARIATFHGERARELEERIDLARDIHDRVVQRLFGVSMALSPAGPLGEAARERCADEVQIALTDLRAAVQRPLGRAAKATGTTLASELERLSAAGSDLELRIDGPVPAVPPTLEPLVQSVLAEAVRNVRKHARARSLVVRARRADGLLVMEVENDGVSARPRGGRPGMGLQLAALEALHAGGLLEFGQRTPGRWQVRLAVPEPNAEPAA